MKRYEEYKDAHEYGYSTIPHHWEIRPTRAHFSFGKGLNITKADLKESGIAVLSYGQIHSKLNSGTKLKQDLIRYVDEAYLSTNTQCLVEVGDFVFADTSEDIEGSGNCAFNDSYETLFAGYHTVIARPKGLSCLPYIAYLFKSREWKIQIQKNVNAVKVYSIGKGLIKQTYLLIPPIEEQDAIVAFLDSKMSKIDAYISEREKEITALGELKQVEIASVVTRGLNPDVPMRDSGIPWLGQIPAHWKELKLSQVAREHYISNKNVHHQNLLSLSYGKIIRKDINRTDGLLPASFDGYQIVEPGNIVLRLTDLQNDQKSLRVGLVTEEGIVTGAYLSLEVRDNILPEYTYLFLHTSDIHKYFYTMGSGIRQGLNYSGIRDIKVPVPSIEEQQAIVDYINAKTAKIDGLIADLSAQIERLKEYKQRLISDAVTGQIDVRDYKHSTSAQ